ncbi:MAG: TAT-dependent nitrous-oxide reductase, partial [Pseudonocardia sp.]|nr:TAT-dependent nitrous-oxide reductase [Pseudonocardia sp.]
MPNEDDNTKKQGLSRRSVLGTTAALAAVGTTAAVGGLGLTRSAAISTAQAQTKSGAKHEVKPGELDEYYVFFSSGQSGEIRIIGMPSMRELMRVPVFNRCSATGWGQTNESRKILEEGLTPEYRELMKDRGGVYDNGDLHHPHPSFTDGTYDGRYLFANDKSNTRVARIRLDVMKCDKIVQLP